MSEYIKSYTLTPEQQAKVDAIMAECKEKYGKYEGIICYREPTEEELITCGYYDE